MLIDRRSMPDRRETHGGTPEGQPDRRRRGRRARVAGQPSSERIWAFLTQSEREALQRVADETGMQIAVIVRDAVNEYVSDFSEHRIFAATDNSTHVVICSRTSQRD